MLKINFLRSKKYANIVLRIVTITPEIAEELIKLNSNNRSIQKRSILIFADDMKNGRWRLNNDAICISEEGVLLNGQHRLLACIRAGVPFDVILVEGFSGEVMGTIDGGVKRTAAQVAGLHGLKNSTLLAATLSWVYRHDCRRIFNANSFHATLILELLDKYPGVEDSITFAKNRSKHARFVLPESLISALHYLITRTWGADEAENFLVPLVHGEGLRKGSPIAVLRNRLISDRATTRGSRLASRLVLALTLKAFAMEQAGQEVKLIRFAENEPFPYLEDAFKIDEKDQYQEPVAEEKKAANG